MNTLLQFTDGSTALTQNCRLEIPGQEITAALDVSELELTEQLELANHPDGVFEEMELQEEEYNQEDVAPLQ